MKHYKPTKHGIAHSVYCMAYGIAYVYGKCVWNAIDRFGEKLEYLIDNNNFFAGVVWGLAMGLALCVLQ